MCLQLRELFYLKLVVIHFSSAISDSDLYTISGQNFSALPWTNLRSNFPWPYGTNTTYDDIYDVIHSKVK